MWTSTPSITQTDEPLTNYRLITTRKITELTCIGRTEIYRLMKEEDFPRPVTLRKRTNVWLESEVKAWLLKRIASRSTPAGIEPTIQTTVTY